VIWMKTVQVVFELVQRGSYYYKVVEGDARRYTSSRFDRYKRETAGTA
jgi:hypothetical protein